MKSQSPRKPFPAFSILVVCLMLGLVGLALIPQLSIQLTPSRSYASVTVQCAMRGASPEVVDLEVTNPIERTLARLHGVQHIRSTSGHGTANVHVSLDKWTDPATFRFEATTVLRQLYPQLPATASYPVVYLNRPAASNAFGRDIIGYTLGGPDAAEGITAVAELRIRPVLAEIKGLYRVDITGIRPTRVAVDVDQARLRQLGSGLSDFQRQLQEGLAVKGLGVVRWGGAKVDLAIDRCMAGADDLLGFPLRGRNGAVFYLRDVATVAMQHTTPTSHYRINGEELVYINMAPEAHVNNIKLAREIRLAMEGVANELVADGYRLDLVYDNTEYIQEELGKIYLRTGLSVLILLLFVMLITRKWRYLLIVVLSLAVNVAVSLIFYYLFRLEIHLYSLAGVTISLGLIIDNVIVIVEDIRHTGRNRIFAAILASTLTALGALSVIFLLEENARLNLLDFALAIIVNLLVSLPVAYFFIPALLERLPVTIRPGKLFFRRKRLVVRFSRGYRRQLAFMLRFRWLCLLVMLLCFGLPLFMLPQNIEGESWWAKAYNQTIGSNFYNEVLRDKVNKYAGGALYLYTSNRMGNSGGGGEEDRVQLFVRITMPNGATLPQMDAVVREFEGFLTRFPDEIERFEARVSGANSAAISIRFNKGFEGAFPHRLKRLLENRAILSGSADFGVYGVGRGFSNAIDLDNFDSTIELRGYHYGQLQAIGLQVRDTLLRNPRVQDVVISTLGRWQQRRYEEFMVGIDRPTYLVSRHIGRQAMGAALQTLDERSALIGTVESAPGVFTPVAVHTNRGNTAPVWSVMHAPLQVNDSTMVRLADVSSVAKVRVGDAIIRDNQEYLLNVHYRFIGTYQLNEIVKKRVLESIRPTLPYGYAVDVPRSSGWFGGGSDDYTHLWLVALVLLIIYMICAILLESFRQPFAVVLMIPFSFIGVFLTFYFLSLQFDQGGYASLLLLSGLVTNAALYIINDFNYLRRGRPAGATRGREVFIRAFHAKAMPILVTTLSAILSLLPFMISGEEKGFWFTLSAGTIGGLLFSILGAYLLLPLCLLARPQRHISKRPKK
ncbi:efflux RND transporter permease subunit [Parapedobacter sp. 10938]|uniref:efflux RND transporter permease subunit n=1 Tax=Parapedobacter flavus TaxID=3110225 RepID=UPI002DBB1176|nr:efflux RND transporter permease subunit [Parapedobacter sp. 10938]MEC3880609.1 efflux RND transporter permease subunit [Parapedobacter sp. 10938]